MAYRTTYAPTYKRVHGLFIGIGEAYAETDLQPLKNPVKEIEEVSKQLHTNDPLWQRPGAIDLLRESKATYLGITRALGRLVENAETDDAVLIYFAGHGTKNGRSFGLCAADVDGEILNGTGYLRRDDLCNYIDRIKAKHVLVILDCCHSAAVFDSDELTRGRGVGEKSGPRPEGGHHRKNFSREFLCSAAADELAGDGTDMSPFAKLLLDELRKTDQKYIAARFLSSNIAQRMDQDVSRSSRMQVPRYKDEQEGSFVFMLRAGK